MRKIILFLFFLNYFNSVFSQSPDWLWAKRMGGTGSDGCNSIALDANGNVYSTGFFYGTVDFDPGFGVFNLTATGSLGGSDVFISKLDYLGNFIWAKHVGGMYSDFGNSITVDPTVGDIYVTGSFHGTVDFNPDTSASDTFNLTAIGNWDLFILKLDSSGDFIWAKAIPGGFDTRGFAISFNHQMNSVYITGFFEGVVDFDPGIGIFNLTGTGGRDIFVLRLNSSGTFIWAKRMGGTNYARAQAIAIDAIGNVYITGWFTGTVDFDPGPGIYNLITGSATNSDILISKLDSSGDFVWARQIAGANNENGFSIAIDSLNNRNIYITGPFYGTVDFDPGPGTFYLSSVGGSDIFISKLDSSGNFIWAKIMGDTIDDSGESISIDAYGNVYTVGYFSGTVDFNPNAGAFYLTSNGSTDIFISKLDSLGNFVWAKAVGSVNSDVATALALNTLGNPYVAGNFSSPSIVFNSITLLNDTSNNTSDIYVAKLDTVPSIPTGISEMQKFNLSIFPNPANEEIILRLGNKITYVVTLRNALGEALFQMTATTDRIKIDMSNFPQGIYFVSVKDQKNNLVTKKVVKMPYCP